MYLKLIVEKSDKSLNGNYWSGVHLCGIQLGRFHYTIKLYL